MTYDLHFWISLASLSVIIGYADNGISKCIAIDSDCCVCGLGISIQ